MEKHFNLLIMLTIVNAQQPLIGPRGYSAKEGQFPCVVFVKTVEWNKCGGTLIDPSYVLTAANCIVKQNTFNTVYDNVTVWTGGVNLTDIPDHRNSEQIFVHKYYDGTSLIQKNNIAIIKLDRPFELSEHIKIAKLARYQPENSQSLTAVSWGDILLNDSTEVLRHTTTTVSNGVKCNFFKMVFGWDTIFCTSHPGTTVCHGDAGGPLFLSTNTVVGIILEARRKPCSIGDLNLALNVNYYLNWIKEKMNQ